MWATGSQPSLIWCHQTNWNTSMDYRILLTVRPGVPLWWCGPDWLKQDQINWPAQDKLTPNSHADEGTEISLVVIQTSLWFQSIGFQNSTNLSVSPVGSFALSRIADSRIIPGEFWHLWPCQSSKMQKTIGLRLSKRLISRQKLSTYSASNHSLSLQSTTCWWAKAIICNPIPLETPLNSSCKAQIDPFDHIQSIFDCYTLV